MVFFRILSFVVGLVTLLAAIFQLMPEAEYRPFFGPKTVLYVFAAILAFCAIYFFIAVSARRTSRSRVRQTVAVTLIALQFGASAWIIEYFPEPYLIGVMGFLLCFTVLLFGLFVWPSARQRSNRRYMRRQEDKERAATAKV